jgi:hypothetical protein
MTGGWRWMLERRCPSAACAREKSLLSSGLFLWPCPTPDESPQALLAAPPLHFFEASTGQCAN